MKNANEALFDVSIHTLDNGLTVYLSPTKIYPEISTNIVVRAGGRDDPQESTGIAHYLEHMLFKGTNKIGTTNYDEEKKHLDGIRDLYEVYNKTDDDEKRADIYKKIDKKNIEASKYAIPNEIDSIYSQIGATGINAYTSWDATVYISTIPSNRLKQWALLESDRFHSPVFRLFLTELEIVYEEKNRSMDSSGNLLYEKLFEGLWPQHPYGMNTILGSVDHLKNPSLERMYTFFNTWYIPKNMAIVLSGDFDPQEALALIEDTFGKWKEKPLPPRKEYPLTPRTEPYITEFEYEDEEVVSIAWETVPYNHKDSVALEVMNAIMDNSASGILNIHLNLAQKLKEAQAFPYTARESGGWFIYGTARADQNIDDVEKLLFDVVNMLKAGDFDEKLLEGVVLNYEIEFQRQLERNTSRVSLMTRAFSHDLPWSFQENYLKSLRAITKDDIIRVAQAYLKDNNYTLVRRRNKPHSAPKMEKPVFTPVAIEPSRKSQAAQRLLDTPTPPPLFREIKLGKNIKQVPFSAGSLYYAPNPVNSIASLSFSFDTGILHDPWLNIALDAIIDYAGLENESPEAMRRRLWARGISLSAQCSRQECTLSIESPEASLKEAIDTAWRLLQNPVIPDGVIESLKQILMAQRQENTSNTHSISSALHSWAFLGDHSQYKLEPSNNDIMTKMTPARIKESLHSLSLMKHDVTYAGSEPVDSVVELLKTRPELPASFTAPPQRVSVKNIPNPYTGQILFCPKAEMSQASIFFMHRGEKLNTQHIPLYQLYQEYIGNGMGSVIFQEIREARALAYAAQGLYSWTWFPGDDTAQKAFVGTQTDKTYEAIQVMSQILGTFPSSQARFDAAKQSVIEGHKTSKRSFRAVPYSWMNWQQAGFTQDPRPQWIKAISELTKKDLEDFAASFKEDKVTIAILGNPKTLDFKKLGRPVTTLDVDDLFSYGPMPLPTSPSGTIGTSE